VALAVRRMRPFPRNWAITPDKRVAPNGPGRMGTAFRAPAGRFDVWFRGSFGRGAKVYLDGRYAGRALAVQTPQQMAHVGVTTLAAGRHTLEIVRPGGNLKPGNGQDEVYDTVFLAPVAPEVPVQRTPAQAGSLCGRHLDWIELVRG
jgi:hypothetical protein